jgi:predicted dienelactone hydrolase
MPDLRPARAVLTNDEVSMLDSVRTHVREMSLDVQAQSRFPVLLLSHGDQMNGFLYSNFSEDLASRGYVVIAVDHPSQALFVAYPDGTAISYSESGRPSPDTLQYPSALSRYLRDRLSERESDLRFVLGHLSDIEVAGRRLTTVLSGRTGAFGHSSGGLAATLLCQAPTAVDACVNMDGRLDAAPYVTGFGKAPPSKPFLYLAKPFRTLTDAELRREGLSADQAARSQADSNERDIRLLSNAGPPAYRAIIQQADHTSFSDEPLLRNPSDASNVKLTEIVRELLHQFFDATLSTGPVNPFEPRNPDVQFTAVAPRR